MNTEFERLYDFYYNIQNGNNNRYAYLTAAPRYNSNVGRIDWAARTGNAGTSPVIFKSTVNLSRTEREKTIRFYLNNNPDFESYGTVSQERSPLLLVAGNYLEVGNDSLWHAQMQNPNSSTFDYHGTVVQSNNARRITIKLDKYKYSTTNDSKKIYLCFLTNGNVIDVNLGGHNSSTNLPLCETNDTSMNTVNNIGINEVLWYNVNEDQDLFVTELLGTNSHQIYPYIPSGTSSDYIEHAYNLDNNIYEDVCNSSSNSSMLCVHNWLRVHSDPTFRNTNSEIVIFDTNVSNGSVVWSNNTPVNGQNLRYLNNEQNDHGDKYCLVAFFVPVYLNDLVTVGEQDGYNENVINVSVAAQNKRTNLIEHGLQ